MEVTSESELAAKTLSVGRHLVAPASFDDDLLQRIEGTNPPLNALVALSPDRLGMKARTPDVEEAADEEPLAGLAGSIKEAISMAGMPRTFGIAAWRDRIAHDDALVVTRVRACGARIIGKSNNAEALADWQTNNPVYGRTNNPYNLARTAGGSGGGGAAAVASGLVDFDIGTDLIGSIRIPAGFCGVYGLRPTQIPGHHTIWSGVDASLDGNRPAAVAGPLARTSRELRRVWHGLTATNPRQPEPVTDISRLRVGYLEPDPGLSFNPSVLEGLEAAAKALEKGHRVRRLAPNRLGEVAVLGRAAIALSIGRIKRDFSAAMQSRSVKTPPEIDPAIMNLIESSGSRQEWSTDVFADLEVVLMPLVPTVAFRHADAATLVGSLQVSDAPGVSDGSVQIPYWQIGAYSAFASLYGFPALAVPLGISPEGLPISAQLMGPHGSEMTLIALSELLAEQVGGVPRPPFSIWGVQ